MTRRGVLAAVLVLVVGACSDESTGNTSSADVGTSSFELAVGREGGVVPLVVGDSDLVTGAEPEIRRTPDGTVGVWRLLAADDAPTTPLVGVEIRPATPVDVRHDRRLANGAWAQVDGREHGATVMTAGPDGELVALSGSRVGLDDLVEVASGLEVEGDELVVLPAGWVEAGSVPVPTWVDGFTSTYVSDETGAPLVSITVERERGDRELLARFGPTEPTDLGIGGWAYRYTAPSAGTGYVFEVGHDLVATVTGELTDAQITDVIASLREAEPGEHDILEPVALGD